MNVIPNKSWNTSWAAGVPGSVAGFGMAHEKYGKSKWRELIYPAVKLAREGFPLDFQNMSYLNHPYYKDYLSKDKETKNIFTKSMPYFINEKFYQTLRKTIPSAMFPSL